MENNLPKAPEPTTDLTVDDRQSINKFIEAGMPGLGAVNEATLARMMDLYLEGKLHRQIARTVRVEKVLVMYLADKFNWYQLRREYLHELELTIRNRLLESKIVSQDFLLQLTQVWQKKIGSQITEYLRTGDENHANNINLKEIDKYLKTIEMLHKITAEGAPKKPMAPAVGLNLGDGVTVKKVGDNEVEITPKSKTIGDVLKQFADSRRKESEIKSDIKKKGDQNEGDQDES
jgi:hypothetical protein